MAGSDAGISDATGMVVVERCRKTVVGVDSTRDWLLEYVSPALAGRRFLPRRHRRSSLTQGDERPFELRLRRICPACLCGEPRVPEARCRKRTAAGCRDAQRPVV